jgi:hypothetical protein
VSLQTFVEPAPAGDPGALADHVPVLLWDADGDNVGLELDGLVEAKERQVVLERLRVELLVRDHDGDFPVLENECDMKPRANMRLHANTWCVYIYPEGIFLIGFCKERLILETLVNLTVNFRIFSMLKLIGITVQTGFFITPRALSAQNQFFSSRYANFKIIDL